MKKYFVALLVAVITSACGIGSNEAGWHRGHITDLSYAGLICKAYEGQIMSGSGNSSVIYNFTITSEAVYKKLQEYQASGTEVNLQYHSPFMYSLCSSVHSNFVDDVQPVKGD